MLKTYGPLSWTLRDRFEAKYIPEPNSGCWLWIGSVDRKGYGGMRVDKQSRRATHISLLLTGIEVPHGTMVCHYCDCPSCVNPAHLFIGTARDNTRDMIKKGRHNFDGLSVGRRSAGVHPSIKSLAKQLFCKGHSVREIASQCKVADNTIYNWAHEWGLPKRKRPEVRTHCPAGHPYSRHNTGRDSRGHRFCRSCRGKAA